MAPLTLADVRPRSSAAREPVVDLAHDPTTSPATAAVVDVSQPLATRLVAELVDRPFRPTAEQLAVVWGGELAHAESPTSRARIAACRYAALFADHVVRDITADGAPGAYARIWQCARLGFIESQAAADPESRGAGDVSRWENDGGRGA